MSSTSWRKDGSRRLRGCGKVDGDFRHDAAGVGRKDQDAVGHQHRLLDVVRHQQDGGDRHAALAPQVEKIGAQGLGGQHVECGERLVHQQHLGVDDQRAREPDTLAHAARQLLRIGALVAVEADQIDGSERTLVALGRRDALRLEAELDVLQHGQPGKEREGLEHHRDLRRPAPRPCGRRSITEPALAGIRPAMMRSKEDLPQPERPSSETISLSPSAERARRRAPADCRRCPWGRAGARRRPRPVLGRSWRSALVSMADLLSPGGSGVRPGDRAAATPDDCRRRPGPT